VGRLILVIDNELDSGKSLVPFLLEAGYRIHSESDGLAGVTAARRLAPDAVVLDVRSPGIDGWEICRRLRQDPATSTLPILFCSAETGELALIRAFELGADDYLTKPVANRELSARLEAVIRRSEGPPDSSVILKISGLAIDLCQRTVTVAGRSVLLTVTQFNLLKSLLQKEGGVISRKELLKLSLREGATSKERTVDVHMTALRKRLGKLGERIKGIPGLGYKFSN
jgi:two-component system OmpR family response regulator